MAAALRLVLLGAPASGKGTQAEELGECLGIPALSTGVIIRAEIARRTAPGIKAERLLAKGQLLPDSDTLRLVSGWLDGAGDGGFILDGFPRTLPQARAFDEQLDAQARALDAAIFLEVPREILAARILNRLQCVGCGRVFRDHGPEAPPVDGPCPFCGNRVGKRDDDTAETFARRYDEYESKTAPLGPYYAARKILKTIDGRGSPATVLRDILAALGRDDAGA